jgi:hypothetical protein
MPSCATSGSVDLVFLQRLILSDGVALRADLLGTTLHSDPPARPLLGALGGSPRTIAQVVPCAVSIVALVMCFLPIERWPGFY